MQFADKLKKAMVDKKIDTAKELSEACDVSYYIVLRLLKNDGSCRISDLVSVANFLNVKVLEL